MCFKILIFFGAKLRAGFHLWVYAIINLNQRVSKLILRTVRILTKGAHLDRDHGTEDFLKLNKYIIKQINILIVLRTKSIDLNS